MIRTAIISPCGKFRYRLGRSWGDGAPLLFVMLNPSTADADQDDPTIRRCIGFAQAHGYNAIEVVNLFAYRATKPAALKAAGYPIGPDNDHHIVEAAQGAVAVCVAWGDNAARLARPAAVLALLRAQGIQPLALDLTDRGIPRHPLMLAARCRLQPFMG
jgi:hypothetical protein